MQDLFQLLQFFGICGLVVPVLQDWRTLALACVSPWRGGGGALQASGLQLHPSTLAMYLSYFLHELVQCFTILYNLVLHPNTLLHTSCTLLVHSAGLRPPTSSLHTCNVPLLHASCTNLYNIAISYTVLCYISTCAMCIVPQLCTSA